MKDLFHKETKADTQKRAVKEKGGIMWEERKLKT